MNYKAVIVVYLCGIAGSASGACPYDNNCLDNPYGAGSRYKSNGLMNPYSQYGSKYSNKSWRNPYANNAPKSYDADGNYRGRMSINPYNADSTSNPYSRYNADPIHDGHNIYIIPQ